MLGPAALRLVGWACRSCGSRRASQPRRVQWMVCQQAGHFLAAGVCRAGAPRERPVARPDLHGFRHCISPGLTPPIGSRRPPVGLASPQPGLPGLVQVGWRDRLQCSRAGGRPGELQLDFSGFGSRQWSPTPPCKRRWLSRPSSWPAQPSSQPAQLEPLVNWNDHAPFETLGVFDRLLMASWHRLPCRSCATGLGCLALWR